MIKDANLDKRIQRFFDVNHTSKNFPKAMERFFIKPTMLEKETCQRIISFFRILIRDKDLNPNGRKDKWKGMPEHISNSRNISEETKLKLQKISLEFLELFDYLNPSYTTQLNEAIHSVKIDIASKRKSWKGSFLPRMALVVLQINDPCQYFIELCHKMGIPYTRMCENRINMETLKKKQLKENRRLESYKKEKNQSRKILAAQKKPIAEYKYKNEAKKIAQSKTKKIKSNATDELIVEEPWVSTCSDESESLKDATDDELEDIELIIALHESEKEYHSYQKKLNEYSQTLNIRTKGLSGLPNPLGFLCYANSAIQIIFHHPQYSTFIANQVFSPNSFGDHLKQLYFKMNQSIPDMNTFWSFIKQNYPNSEFATLQQQDFSHFMLFTLNEVERSFNSKSSRLIYQNLIVGEEYCVIKCPNCSSIIRKSREHFNNIILNINKDESNIFELITSNSVEESSQLCELCKTEVFPRSIYTYTKLPVFLFIEMSRMMNGEQSIIVAETITLEAQEFHLTGFVVYRGDGNAGHYISIVKEETSWYEFSDDIKQQIQLKTYLNDKEISRRIKAIFYEKENK